VKTLWRVLTRLQSKIFVFLIAAAAFSSCSKEEPKKEFVARVNDSYLTSADIDSMIGSGSYSKYYRNELIRNWVKREILYQQALREGLPDDPEFRRIIENSQKELAAASMLKKFFDEESFIYEPRDVAEYFEKNKNDFKLFDDSYLVNLIYFNDEDKAVRFRQTAVESDWNKALNVFNGDSSIIKEETRSLKYEHQVHPESLLRILNELYSQEISIILSDEEGNFSVVQMIEKFEKGTIPPFDTIKQQVENKFIAFRKEYLLKDYLRELYSDNEIEIKDIK